MSGCVAAAVASVLSTAGTTGAANAVSREGVVARERVGDAVAIADDAPAPGLVVVTFCTLAGRDDALLSRNPGLDRSGSEGTNAPPPLPALVVGVGGLKRSTYAVWLAI
jgi:hypothetical protein